jgi:quercetin dioxygenase-like cupin family protein/uncharacterized damage-inducible protein DinB
MFRRAIPFLFAFALFVPVGLAAQDAPTVAPTMYKVLLDDDRVRVMEVTIKPGAEMGVHTHLESVVHALTAAKLRITYADGKTEDLDLQAGETMRMPAGAPHSTKNVGRTALKGDMTELKEAAPAATLTGGERTEILDLYDRSQNDFQSLVARTTDEQWSKKPAPDRWSVGEVVEHLAIVEKALNGFILQTLAAPVNPNWAVVETSRPIDTILRNGTDRSRKFQSPEFAMPKGQMSRADALAMYGGARAQNAELVRRTSAEVKKHTADVPNGGVMTMHQLMAYVGIHNLRHNAQIAEVLGQLEKK